MKRLSTIILVAIAMFLVSHIEALGWNRNGHAAIAYIAERHLTPTAKANIEAAIDGRSIVYYASWLDYHRCEAKSWNKLRHTCDFDAETFEPIGNPRKQIVATIKALRNHERLTDSARKIRIYHLLHSFGDFHCPGHNRYFSHDKEGKRYNINSGYDVMQPNGKVVNYHKFWDADLLGWLFKNMGYMDFGEMLDRNLSQEYIDNVVEGSVEDWLEKSARRCRIIYTIVPPTPKGTPKEQLSRFDYTTLNSMGELASEQIVRGGLRLAQIINSIFDTKQPILESEQ